MKSIIISLIISILLSSCAAYHQGDLIPARGILRPEAQIQYLENLEGKAQASYFLGLGGLEQSRLVKLAKQNMLSKRKLNSNEVLFDYTLDSKTLWVIPPFYYKKTVFITADVYRIGESETVEGETSMDQSENKAVEKKKPNIEVGDVVYFKDGEGFIKAIVLSYKYPFARLEFKKKDKMATAEKIIKELYKKAGEEYIKLLTED